MLKALRVVISIAGLLCAAFGGWYWYTHHSSSATKENGRAKGSAGENKVVPVQVVQVSVERMDVPIYLDGLGTVQAYNSVTVRPQIDGKLSAISFKEGQDVKAGDPIAEIDPRIYQAQLDEALAHKKQNEAKKKQDEAKVLQDRAKLNQDDAEKSTDEAAVKVTEAKKQQDAANLANTRVNLKRYTESFDAAAVTEQQVADQRSQVAQLEAAVVGDEATIQAAVALVKGDVATLEADRAAIASDEAAVLADDAAIAADDAAIAYANTFLSYTKITSPIDGRTGVRQVDVGNIVRATGSATDPGIVVITQLKPISVIFTLPQQHFPQISSRMTQEKLPVVAVEADGITEIERGTLELIDNQIDQTTGTLHMKAKFDNNKGRLWPGGFVNVRLLVDTKRGASVVEAPAIQRGPESTYVYVIKADETVEPRDVKVALIQDNKAVIDEGVRPGEKVVLTGHDRLKTGTKVSIAGKKRGQDSPEGAEPQNTKKKPADISKGNESTKPRTTGVPPVDAAIPPAKDKRSDRGNNSAIAAEKEL